VLTLRTNQSNKLFFKKISSARADRLFYQMDLARPAHNLPDPMIWLMNVSNPLVLENRSTLSMEVVLIASRIHLPNLTKEDVTIQYVDKENRLHLMDLVHNAQNIVQLSTVRSCARHQNVKRMKKSIQMELVNSAQLSWSLQKMAIIARPQNVLIVKRFYMMDHVIYALTSRESLETSSSAKSQHVAPENNLFRMAHALNVVPMSKLQQVANPVNFQNVLKTRKS
jgi:hypothetical protein